MIFVLFDVEVMVDVMKWLDEKLKMVELVCIKVDEEGNFLFFEVKEFVFVVDDKKKKKN